MHYLNPAGKDDSQKSRWNENANFKAESEDAPIRRRTKNAIVSAL
jgi:hypothetical protein